MTFGELEIGAFVATFLRAVGLAVTSPVIGDNGVSKRARLVFVLAIAVAVGPARDGVAYNELAQTGVLELAVGLLTGLTARFVMARVAVAGQLIGLSLGLGFAAQYDARAGESAGTFRMLSSTVAALAFLSGGGLEEIARSTAAAPARVEHLLSLGPALIEYGSSAFGHGLALASPIVLAALVGNVGLALMNRAAPAANVFSISLAGVLVIGGFVLLATASGFVTGVIEAAKNAGSIFSQ
jgi:flagellar biosynthetic protein FliR